MKYFVVLFCALLAMGCASKKKQARYFDYKVYEDEYAKITDSLYAGITEVSNREYTTFLKDLKSNGKEAAATKYNFDSVQWRKPSLYQEPMVQYYHRHPAYADYPAVTISYEGATAYCRWLTEEYHKQEKRKFKKVIFRLPTKEEWVYAARGGKENQPFPWGGPYVRNSRGMYLANFKEIDESSAKDTTINGEKIISVDDYGVYNNNSTTPVKSYFPNNYGLYNMSGNVSEMLQEKGQTKGGNWNSMSYYLRIDAEDEFKGNQTEASPFVGFRVFVEVIEM